MSDFYHILKAQTETEAQELALCLELFVEGSLNIFNHHTNVDEDNRLTVYGIQDLGSQLAPVAMLVMMEAIQSRIIENGKKGRATWIYIDECHVLLNSDYSATYLQQLWKKVRKQGGLCTGISQNVTDLLQNYIASTLISNSEFIALLKQSNIDSAKLAEVIGVSDAQLRFVSNSPSGTGLIKCGSVVIPFDNTIGKDTALVISLLEMVNKMTVNSNIASVRHAAAMLGQKELKRWINTAVTKGFIAFQDVEVAEDAGVHFGQFEIFAVGRAAFFDQFQIPALSQCSTYRDCSSIMRLYFFSVLRFCRVKQFAHDRSRLRQEIRQSLK